jgi:hypothetical protein
LLVWTYVLVAKNTKNTFRRMAAPRIERGTFRSSV